MQRSWHLLTQTVRQQKTNSKSPSLSAHLLFHIFIRAMDIRRVKDDDIVRITDIYNWYILNTTVTFETETINPLEMKKRVQEKIANHDWLVGELNQEIIGYAYYGSFRSRPAYNHTVELTVYLAQENVGKGFGKILYGELIESAEQHGFRELIGVIALPNQKSTTLHQKLGFEEIGVLKKVGYKFDRYIDVGIWQKSILVFNDLSASSQY